MKLLFRLTAAFVLGVISFSTLAPIELRPHLMEANSERFSAYLLLGWMVTLGFPRAPGVISFAVVPVPIGLELMQLVDSSRHGQILDAALKVSGGLVGVLLATLVMTAIQGRGGRRP
jgi:hypothetical protein